jgi:hypothetical protein
LLQQLLPPRLRTDLRATLVLFDHQLLQMVAQAPSKQVVKSSWEVNGFEFCPLYDLLPLCF